MTALLGGFVLASACRPANVTVDPHLEVGDRARYRYEIEAEVTRALENATPTTTRIDTELVADQEVTALTEDGAEAAVTLRRTGSPPRAAQVVLDRAGAIRSIELVEDLTNGAVGLGELGSLFPPSTAPPTTPLAPGDRWSISEDGLEGEGRLARLGVVDGADVAVVETSLVEALEDAVAAGTSAVSLDGELRSEGTIAYDLADGSMRRSSSRSRGDVRAVIQPPPGVGSEPAHARITYDIRVRVTRLD